MGKFIRENEKVTKANFASMANRFRAVANAKLTTEGKSNYRIAVEKMDKQDNQSAYIQLLSATYWSLSDSAKREFCSKVPDAVKRTNANRIKSSIKRDLAEDPEFTDEKILEHVKAQVRGAKNYDELLAAIKPYISQEQYRDVEYNPKEMRVEILLENLDPKKVKQTFLDTIENAATPEKAKEIALPFMGKEKLSQRKYSEYDVSALYFEDSAEEIFAKAAEELDEEEIVALAEAADNYQPLHLKSWEEVGTHPLAENTAAVEKMILGDSSMTEEEKKEITEMMDKIDKDTIVTETKHINTLNDRRKNTEEALTRDSAAAGENALKSQGVDPDPTEITLDNETGRMIHVVKENKQQDFEKMKSIDMQFSDETKAAIKSVFAKLEQYGYVSNGIPQEQGVKAYALTEYLTAINKYQEALGKAVETGDVSETVKYAKEVNVHNEQVHDVLNEVRENFPVGDGDVYPGNVDILRNNAFPVDLRQDIKGVSQLNGLYAVYGFIKENNLDVDEFLNHPVQCVENYYRDVVYKVFEPTEQIKGKSGAEAIWALTYRPAENIKYTSFGVPRVVESLTALEKDPELKAKNSAASVAFAKTTHDMFNDHAFGIDSAVEQNLPVIDRVLIVKEPQLDGKLLNCKTFDPTTGKIVSVSDGFDEAEYISRSAETPFEFLERLKENVHTYMDKNAKSGHFDRSISNDFFIEAAQKAAAKYLMVKGSDGALGGQDDASKELLDFVNDGKTSLDRWIDERYPNATTPEEKKRVQDLHSSFACKNPYADMVRDCNSLVASQMSKKGNTREYANGERAANSIDEKKSYLTTAFRDGKVPQSFYAARMEQLNKGDVGANMPPFFRADDLPKRDKYIEQTYGAESVNELSEEEKDMVYAHFVEQAQAEKRTFLTKKYMADKNLVIKGQFFTTEEMEELYPAAREEAERAKSEYEAKAAEQKRQENEKENSLSHDERVKFVREGETLTKETFPAMMNRFLSYNYREFETNPNATEMQNAIAQKQNYGDHLRGRAFMNALRDKLSSEQMNDLFNSLPESNKKIIYRNIGKTLETAARDKCFAKDDEIKAMPEGPAKEAAKRELNEMNEIRDRLWKGDMRPEEAIRLARPLISDEKFNKLNLSLAGNAPRSFFVDNVNVISAALPQVLSEADLRELAQKADEYKVPWERDKGEIGEKVYTEQTKKAKADILAMTELNGVKLDENAKARIIDNLEKANDFLRGPGGENMDSYLDVASEFQRACLHIGSAAGERKIAEEGFDSGAIEEKQDEYSNENLVVKEGKEEEIRKWDEAEYEMSEETKSAIKYVFGKMHEFGYDQAGVVGEEGSSKEYGLGKLASGINAYKEAVASGDAVKIAEASEKMLTEKERVDELLGYIKEHFPVKEGNFAIAGNVDVARNDLFPPYLRYDDAAVTQFNSLYIAINYATAHGIAPEEFIEHPAKYMKEIAFGSDNKNINNTLVGKSGGAALFEACLSTDNIKGIDPGYARAFEAFNFFDMDPEVRAHNHGLGNYLDQAVLENNQREVQNRSTIYRGDNSHLDRLLFVSEPQKDASLLGIRIYSAKDLGYIEPKPFDEFAYLRNNGKSIAEMKEQIDKNIAEYLKLNAENRNRYGKSLQAISQQKFLKIVQSAAEKVLMAKVAERDSTEYRALEELLSDGNAYIKGVIENNKLIDKSGNPIDFTAEGEKNRGKSLAEFKDKVDNYRMIAAGDMDLKSDKAFFEEMNAAKREVEGLDKRISERSAALGNDAAAALDDEYQALNAQKEVKLAEIRQKSAEYMSKLGDDVKTGRIPESLKDALVSRTMAGNFDDFPTPFAVTDLMTKEQYIASLAGNPDYNLNDYDEADRDALYEMYVARKEVPAEEEAQRFAARRYAKDFGFTDVGVAAPERGKEQKPEIPKEYSGKMFKPGEEVTKSNLAEKLIAMDEAKKAEPKGKSWFEKRQIIEAAENNGKRLAFIYEEATKRLTGAGKKAVIDALDQKTRESLEKNTKRAYVDILQKKGGAAKTLGDSIKADLGKMTLDEVKTIAGAHLTAQEKADPRLVPFNHISYTANIDGKNAQIWRAVVADLSEKDISEITRRADSMIVATEKPLEENKVERFKEEFDAVKNITDKMKSLHGKPITEEDRANIAKTLDEAKDHLSDVSHEYFSIRDNQRSSREESDYGMNYTRSREAEAEATKEGVSVIEAGGVNALRLAAWKKQNAGYTTIMLGDEVEARVYQLEEGGAKGFDALREKEIEYSPETKKAILDVFRKMDEFGYDKVPFSGEEQYKIYGLRLYDNARIDFEKQLNSKDPAEQIKAIDSANKMNTEYAHAKELLGMIHKSFAVEGDVVNYPGNLDVLRNDRMPPEFRDDIAGMSTLNGLYMSYRFMKQLGLSPEEFVNAPKKAVTKEADKLIAELDLNKAIIGNSGADAITEIGKEKHAIINMGTAYMLSRTMEAMAKLEKDPEMAKSNALAEYGYSMTTAFLLDEINERQDVYEAVKYNLDKFLLVKEPLENADLIGVPVFDFEGTKRVGEAKYFDEAQYLLESNETPEEFVDRMNGEIINAFEAMQNNRGKTRLTSPILIDAFSTAASKYAISLGKEKQVGEAFEKIKEMATRGNEYIEKVLNEAVEVGRYEQNVSNLDLSGGPSNPHIIRDFNNSLSGAVKAQQRMAKPVISADERLNKDVKQIDKSLAALEKKGNLTEADSRKKEELLDRRSALISERKEALLDAYAEGRIPKEYLERRSEQLDKGPFDKNVPLFEADKPMSKRDFQAKMEAEGKTEDVNAAYAKYTQSLNDKKRMHFVKTYMEQENLTQKEKKPNREEREQQRKKEEEKTKAAAKEGKAAEKSEEAVENIAVNIEEEKIAEKADKIEEKDASKEKTVEEEVALGNDGGERIVIDLDDDSPQIADDMLSIGNEKKKDLDDLTK